MFLTLTDPIVSLSSSKSEQSVQFSRQKFDKFLVISFQIFQSISQGELLTGKYISQKPMFLENDKIVIRHCLVISIKFGCVNFKREWANTATVARPINRIFSLLHYSTLHYSVCSLCWTILAKNQLQIIIW